MSSFGTRKSLETNLEKALPSAAVRPNGGSRIEPIDVLSDRFNLIESLGSRGDVRFYLAEDKTAGADASLVTLKVFTGTPAASAKELELFDLETSAAALLSHPNVIATSSPQEYKGVHFALIEHSSGVETLSELLDREGWLDIDQALNIVNQVAGALEHAHSAGVLHLRIDPENILIEPDGAVLVGDFGIGSGKQLAWAHKQRSRQCRAHYVSPEQVTEKPLDESTDLYSMGVVIYQMLTDRLPFDSEDSAQIRQRIITQSPLPPDLYRPEISPALSDAIVCLLEKNPEKRFQSVASFRAALDGSLNPSIALAAPEIDSQPEPVEDSANEERQLRPIEERTLEVPREPYESPSITVINSFEDRGGIVATESEVVIAQPTVDEMKPEGGNLGLTAERAELFEGHEDAIADSLIQPLAIQESTALSVPEQSLTFGASTDPQWRPMVLLAILVIAVISAVALIENASHARGPNPTDSQSPVTSGKDERGGTAPAPAALSPPEPAHQPTTERAEERTDSTSSKTVSQLNSSGRSSASNTRRRTGGYSSSRRKTRAKSKRYSIYFRDYTRYPSRVY